MPDLLVAPLSVAEAGAFLDEHYPQLNVPLRAYEVLAITPEGCTVRLHASDAHLRAGGTVSGPTLFTLADVGGYVCAVAHAGRDALAVTTHLSIDFLRKAPPGAVDARCRILKLGRRLMVFDAEILSADGTRIAHATGTYAIPPHTTPKPADHHTVK